jgi:hypothetical protein
MRKVAAHDVILPDGKKLSPGIVEMTAGTVVKTYSFEEEQAGTEWLGGTIEIRQVGASLKAFKNKKPI